MTNSSIWRIDSTLCGAITLGQSGPWSDGNEGLLRTPQSSSITWDCFVSYLGHSLERVLPLFRDAVGELYSSSRLGRFKMCVKKWVLTICFNIKLSANYPLTNHTHTHTHTHAYLSIYLSIMLYYPPPRLGQDMTRGQFLKWSLTGLNSEFSFSETSCLAKAKEPSLPYYLLIAGRRIIGFIPLPRVLVLCEMQSAPSRIWNRIAVSISYDDNHYTTGTSNLYIYIWDVELDNPQRLTCYKTYTQKTNPLDHF